MMETKKHVTYFELRHNVYMYIIVCITKYNQI